MSNVTRISYINSLLQRLGTLRLLQNPTASDRIFELFCYFRKIDEFMIRGRTPECKMMTSLGIFQPHAKPGNPRSASYFSIVDPLGGETTDLILNGRFAGASGVLHSPDLVLARLDSNDVVSIYECKNHSGNLGLGVYREFIGYCEEMELLQKANRSRIKTLFDSSPEMRPCIYTSAVANRVHKEGMETYNFSVKDRL
jgi:hypothetical protein